MQKITTHCWRLGENDLACLPKPRRMFDNLPQWWDGLTTFEQIYWTIAIPFTLIFCIQTVLTFIGAEMDADDMDIDGEAELGFQFFTIKNFVAFFTFFGWTGIATLDAGMSLLVSVVIALLAGLTMMTVMASIFYMFSKLTDSGTMDVKNAIGGVGEVYLTVKAKRGNIGKVSIMVQGSLRELEAITDDEQDLNNGMVITVKDVINGNLLLISKS